MRGFIGIPCLFPVPDCQDLRQDLGIGLPSVDHECRSPDPAKNDFRFPDTAENGLIRKYARKQLPRPLGEGWGEGAQEERYHLIFHNTPCFPGTAQEI